MHAQIYTGTYSVCTVCNNTVFNNADPEEMNAARSRCDTAHKFSINTGLPGTFFFFLSPRRGCVRVCGNVRTPVAVYLFILCPDTASISPVFGKSGPLPGVYSAATHSEIHFYNIFTGHNCFIILDKQYFSP